MTKGRRRIHPDMILIKTRLDPIQLSNALSLGYVRIRISCMQSHKLFPSVRHMIGPMDKQWRPIRLPLSHPETDIEPCEYIFTDFDTDNSDAALLFKKQANGSIFRGVDRMRLISNIINARRENGGCHLDVYKLIEQNCIIAFFPLHDYVELRALEEKWLVFFQLPWKQDVDSVKDYFGEKIGMYFLWLSHYTSWLIGASVVGFCAWIFVAGESKSTLCNILTGIS
jgi:hypothetical protein